MGEKSGVKFLRSMDFSHSSDFDTRRGIVGVGRSGAPLSGKGEERASDLGAESNLHGAQE